MASVDGTEVLLNGVSQGLIDAGESIRITDIAEGDEITATHPVQANIFTGDIGSRARIPLVRALAARSVERQLLHAGLRPDGKRPPNPTRVWLYNPTPRP